MAGEECTGLACLTEDGCLSHFPNGELGQTLVMGPDLPEWSTRNTSLSIIGQVMTYMQYDGEEVDYNVCDDIIGKCGIGSLNDVETALIQPTAGDVLAFDGVQWVPADLAIPAAFACTDLGFCSVNALGDVDTATSAPAVGNTLIWNGGAWVPGTPATTAFQCSDLGFCSIDALGDVDTVTNPLAVGNTLVWNGGAWVNEAVPCPAITITTQGNCGFGSIGPDNMVLSASFNQATCQLEISSAAEHTTINGMVEQAGTGVTPNGATQLLIDFSISFTNPSTCRSMRYFIAVRPGRPSVTMAPGNRWAFEQQTITTDPDVTPLALGDYARFDSRNAAGPTNESQTSGAEFYTGFLFPGVTRTWQLVMRVNSAPTFVDDPINNAGIGRSYIAFIASTV